MVDITKVEILFEKTTKNLNFFAGDPMYHPAEALKIQYDLTEREIEALRCIWVSIGWLFSPNTYFGYWGNCT